MILVVRYFKKYASIETFDGFTKGAIERQKVPLFKNGDLSLSISDKPMSRLNSNFLSKYMLYNCHRACNFYPQIFSPSSSTSTRITKTLHFHQVVPITSFEQHLLDSWNFVPKFRFSASGVHQNFPAKYWLAEISRCSELTKSFHFYQVWVIINFDWHMLENSNFVEWFMLCAFFGMKIWLSNMAPLRFYEDLK